MLPVRGSSSPKTDFISVDFPAPLGPTIVTISPSRTSMSTPFRMSTSGVYPATRSFTLRIEAFPVSVFRAAAPAPDAGVAASSPPPR